MQWRELDHRVKTWIIPGSRTKNGLEHLVHLSPLAWEVIDSVARNAEGRFKYPHVFPATEQSYITGYSKAKATLDETIKEIFGSELDPWRIHDLRRTGASGLAMLKVQPHIVERVLNHISGSVSAKMNGIDASLVRIYQRFQYAEERKEALDKWSNHINGILDANAQRAHSSITTELPTTPLIALPAPG